MTYEQQEAHFFALRDAEEPPWIPDPPDYVRDTPWVAFAAYIDGVDEPPRRRRPTRTPRARESAARGCGPDRSSSAASEAGDGGDGPAPGLVAVPRDPRVRAFLDALAEAVADAVLADLDHRTVGATPDPRRGTS